MRRRLQDPWIRPVDQWLDYDLQPDGHWGLPCEAGEACGDQIETMTATWMIGGELDGQKKAYAFCAQHAAFYCCYYKIKMPSDLKILAPL